MAADAVQRLRGKFIVFDGVDGAGKGSQMRMLSEALTKAGLPVVQARDPGGTEIGDRIRHVLLDYDLSRMDVRCEALLFMASRAQLAKEIIDPALAEGKTVLCDRFVSATCAYQGAAGFDPKRVIELARFAIDKTWPHLTLIFDVSPEVGFQRTHRKTQSARKSNHVEGQTNLFHDHDTDAMEARPLAFHRRVRKMFAELGDYYPGLVSTIDAAGTPEVVHHRVMEAIERAAF